VEKKGKGGEKKNFGREKKREKEGNRARRAVLWNSYFTTPWTLTRVSRAGLRKIRQERTQKVRKKRREEERRRVKGALDSCKAQLLPRIPPISRLFKCQAERRQQTENRRKKKKTSTLGKKEKEEEGKKQAERSLRPTSTSSVRRCVVLNGYVPTKAEGEENEKT